jgi:tetratricopeptide (TPR) repeat protein
MLRPDGRPLSDLEHLAGVLSGQQADGKESAAAWQALRDKYGAEFKPNEDRVQAWEVRGAEECESRGLWHGAVAHLDRLIEGTRTPGELYARRAQAHTELRHGEQAQADYAKALGAEPKRWDLWAGKAAAAAGQGHWDEAVADYTKAIELRDGDPDLWQRRGQAEAERGKWDRAAADLGKALALGRNDSDLKYQHAVALLTAGDREGYRRACARLVQRPRGSDDAAALRAACRICSLAPDAVADWQPLVRRAEQAVEANPGSAADLGCLGALLYRSGKFELALRLLERAARSVGDEPAPRDWLFLAMAQQRLGQAGEARKWLGKATAWLDKAGAERGKEGTTSIPWQDWQDHLTLRREAESLIREKSP